MCMDPGTRHCTHDGMLLLGWVPLYCKLKDSHAASPRGVESFMLYKCVALENGGLWQEMQPRGWVGSWYPWWTSDFGRIKSWQPQIGGNYHMVSSHKVLYLSCIGQEDQAVSDSHSHHRSPLQRKQMSMYMYKNRLMYHYNKLRMKNPCNARSNSTRMGMLNIHVNIRVSIESITWRRKRWHKVRRNGTSVMKRWLRQGWNRRCMCYCIRCMGFKSIGRVFCLYVSGASAFSFEVSRTVGTCKGWRRRTKGIGVILIWHHCKCTSQRARWARDLRRMAQKCKTALADS